LAGERFLRGRRPTPLTGLSKLGAGVLVFSLVTLAWLLFKLPQFEHVVAFVMAIRRNIGYPIYWAPILYIVVYSLPVVLYHLSYLYENRIERFAFKARVEPIFYAVLLFFVLTNSGIATDFIYFQF
jgi:alginate O-acetyltransferase complex protein AlgI